MDRWLRTGTIKRRRQEHKDELIGECFFTVISDDEEEAASATPTTSSASLNVKGILPNSCELRRVQTAREESFVGVEDCSERSPFLITSDDEDEGVPTASAASTAVMFSRRSEDLCEDQTSRTSWEEDLILSDEESAYDSREKGVSDHGSMPVSNHEGDAGAISFTALFDASSADEVSGNPSGMEVKKKNKSKTPKHRKYTEEYLKFGFSWTGHAGMPRPLCVLCSFVMKNECMKPSKLARHFRTKHSDHAHRSLDFFKRKRMELNRGVSALRSLTSGEAAAKASRASYEVALLIAKAGKAHTIGEVLIKPVISRVNTIMLGEKARRMTDKVPLSNNTIQRRIESMASDVEDQLIARITQSQYFALQVDESTDVAGEAQLLACVRYEHLSEVHEELLFCKSLPTTATGRDIFEVFNDYVSKKRLDWKRCVDISTDGAASMTGRVNGLVARIKQVAPLATSTHCCIHREQLASKKLPKTLKTVIDEEVQIVNFTKGRPTNARIFRALCEDMGSEHRNLLFYTEVRWLSGGKVFTRLFELRDELRIYLSGAGGRASYLCKHMNDVEWLVQLGRCFLYLEQFEPFFAR